MEEKMIDKKERLFWWNEKHFHNHKNENYGDVLGRYLFEKISNKKVIFSIPNKWSYRDLFSQPIYLTIGSILANVNKKCIVWGSGIISENIHVNNAKYIAVRGPRTRSYLLNKGYHVPEVYGDPALLLPRYYKPKIIKKYTLGIIPHNYDYESVLKEYSHLENVKVISLKTNDVEKTTNEILACERVVSSSLHGVIVSHAYQIPAIWVEFSDKLFGDGIKFIDYFESVNLIAYHIKSFHEDLSNQNVINQLFKNYPSLPLETKIKSINDNLLKVCPFKI
jgi:hypothetical protein